MGMLQYISNVAWKYLFGKTADNLERSTENEDECKIIFIFNCFKIIIYVLSLILDMIHENAPITNTFVSVPPDMGQLNCAAFIAGIIAGMLDSSRFVSLLASLSLV